MQSLVTCTVQVHSLRTAEHAHRAAIERLRGDNALLKEEVMLENRFSVAPTSAAAAAAIAGLQEQSEVYNQKVRALLSCA